MRRVAHSLFTAIGLLAAGGTSAQVTWRTDSLMTNWAVKQRLAEMGNTLGRGVVRAVDTDHLYADLKREAPGIPVFADSNVVLYTDLYGEPLREQFRVLLGVGQVYFPMIEKELALQGLPTELKYLPMALSALNTQAAATNGRGGLWMLTYPVALRYGLKMTGYVDERHDDVKSTMAAGRYLKDLYARYRDPSLAIAAFACGPANVTRAQQRAGGATDLRSLYPHFTEGEQEVLPLLMAFIHLSANAEMLGLAPIEIMPWEMADTITATDPVQLKALAQVMRMPLSRIHALNPTLCSGEVPTGHTFHLPRMMGPRYAALTDSVQRLGTAMAQATAQAPRGESEQLVDVVVEKSIRYTVRSGDNLGGIATKHHVTVRQLRAWNNLRSDRINAGRTLIIKVRKHELVKPTEPEPQLPEDEGPVNSNPTTPTEDRAEKPTTEKSVIGTSYTVQHGDTLYRIAKRFPGLTAQNIMEANGIGTAIIPGQELKIPQP
jgi:membrane-bound lytic murein transglycosylase D